MGRIARLSASGCALAVALIGLPATTADAAAVNHGPARGTLVVCSADNLDVYADGPSVREDDLAAFTKSGECTHWKPVIAGRYQIGFGERTAWPAGSVIIQVRI